MCDEHELEAEGFGGLLAVGGGRRGRPGVVLLEHAPEGAAGARQVVLVGKGITFDTGGLARQAARGMVPMKTDMSGGGDRARRAGGVPRRRASGAAWSGLLPLAENALGAASYRPGDVLAPLRRPHDRGDNTDAEGRVVLADALAWADAHLDPDAVVDVATLTGAASLGAGPPARGPVRHRRGAGGGPRGGRRRIRGAAVAHAARRGLPRGASTPTVADVRQAVTTPGFGAGSITAALFLREFAGARPWAHLDIAGPARSDSGEHEVPKGATGYGARLLLRWLESLPVDAEPS